MGEIDTKPIEPVQVALSLFGEKGDHRKHRSAGSDTETDKEELQGLHKELANYKVQIEAKESAYMQALLKLQQYSERVDELSSQLMKSELERDKYDRECMQARTSINMLESKTKEMADQLSETVKIREQLSHVLNELKSAQVELLGMETELAVEREARLKALTRTEELEADNQIEKGKVGVLLKHVEELNEVLLMSKQAAKEAEKEKWDIISQKDAEVNLATDAAVQMQEQLNNLKNQLGMIEDLENQVLVKSTYVESLQSDLREVKELLSSSERATSNATTDLEKWKADLEVKKREVSDQAAYIEVLQMELNQMKREMKTANERLCHMSCDLETLTEDLQNAESELSEMKENETEAQVELALLKSQLHKARSIVAAAEAAEVRADSVKSGLYLAVQQLALEAGEAKKECQRLQEEADKVSEEPESFTFATAPVEVSAQDEEIFENASSEVEEGLADENSTNITISLEEYESLLALAKKADEMRTLSVEDSNQHAAWGSKQEVEILKRELEAASSRIGEFRTRAEQAASRAEAAENAKSALEDQLRRWREQKQRRKAAVQALREESISREFNPPTYDSTPTSHIPLFKILNMKF
ncbi:protein WEAK CHLOROPLAST MOVEMENT UNDER BLUE LIGHT 1-like [Rhodamnia argentea]|uniref:Protein WEAK CHLOROPLAST MOVEMENT UNDER BLUE LIGHT 1-like n=1 Tax=Rhodamnia argentea TaxID=178133 RepID=A0A8B8PAI2_9MYRT|nr:protein WEAK CHLOROPLAST MOVEMENT UNDER BLUE LIGHT 1-like [Rhodamnia argentea]XP_030531786.1 protein WEAK CHLOROPLAST MOVEMENT UNDER BLUE LIGHT 1-like [Rhodamnia argentea]